MNENLGIDSFSIGVSARGMGEYAEALKADLLVTTQEKLEEEKNNILASINQGWQGVARDRFQKQLEDACTQIGDDLVKEYNDLAARLVELQQFYFEQDKTLIGEE